MATLTRHSIHQDFAASADQTADLLEEGRFDELDVADLVDEVRGLARNEFHALQSQIDRLLIHLLKWAYQPTKRSTSWQVSIADARNEIEERLKASPSLRSKLNAESISGHWQHARKIAALQTRLPRDTFPEACPWDLETQVFADEWLP